MKCNIVGWWPSHPAEPINGVKVSNHYQRAVAPFGRPWPMKPGTVHPERLVRNLAALRVHPQELDVRMILKFVPRLAEIDQATDRRIENLAKIIADCTTINRAAVALMHHEPWDFTAVYFDAIDHFCHGFMDFHPPKLDWVDAKQQEFYQNVVEAGYIYHDFLLGSLLEEIDTKTTVIIASDHGFHSDHMRPKHIPQEPAGPAVQHRSYGILAVKGPGIRKDEIIYGASLLDICPTILAVFRLPVGQDMDGKPLINLFAEPRGIDTVPTWDDVQGQDGSHPPEKTIDPIEAREAISQLVSLSYIEEPGENALRANEEAVRELRYNLARSHVDAGQYGNASPILKELLEDWPEEYRFGIQLVICYQALGEMREARSLLEELFSRKEKAARKAARELEELKDRNQAISPGDITREDRRKIRKLRYQASTSQYAMEYLMGTLFLVEGNAKEAVAHLKRALGLDSTKLETLNKLGEAYGRLKLWLEAEKSYERSLEIDPENAEAHFGLARIFLARRKNRAAAEVALAALALRYHNPQGHFLLGTALHRLGRLSEAVSALKMAIAQHPLFPDAHQRLARIYERHLKDKRSAEQYRELARQSRAKVRDAKSGKLEGSVDLDVAARTSLTSDQTVKVASSLPAPPTPIVWGRTVIIVSGLPRSGTSMMMQMLAAGGIPVFTDGVRVADEDNSLGYYEHERAKQLGRDSSWLYDARGKAVKIVAQLLPYLPRLEDLNYRVILMERDLVEVLNSQQALLQRRRKPGARLLHGKLKAVFAKQLQRTKDILSLKDIPFHCFDYNQTLGDSAGATAALNAYLGGILDANNVANVVDAGMKRQGKM
jgi:tetratricopeptide (TPR) repeat protein